MAGSVNKAILIGNLGRDPEVRMLSNGKKVVNFSVATSESWKKDGNRETRTEWHNVSIFNERLGEVAATYLKKGAKVYIEGSISTRKWTAQDGSERASTEIVINQFRGELTLLDSKENGSADASKETKSKPAMTSKATEDVLDDEIPF